jgi:hypothetical protein
MTEGELDALLAELQRSTPLKRLTTPSAAKAVFLTLLSKGYTLVRPKPGDKYKLVESDEEKHHIVRWLQDCSPLGALSYPEAAAVFNALGYRIRKPDRHPSGLATTEQAHTDVKPLGAIGNSRKVISKGAPVGPTSIFNGGTS